MFPSGQTVDTWCAQGQWRRPGAEFGGGHFFRVPRFLNEVFSEKMSIFTGKISDDLFLVNDQVFPFVSQVFRIFYYVTLSSQEQLLFRKRIPLWHLLLLCSYFRAHPTTLLLKILVGRMHGPCPTSKFGGDRPPVPPRSPPLLKATISQFCYCWIWLIFLWESADLHIFKTHKAKTLIDNPGKT